MNHSHAISEFRKASRALAADIAFAGRLQRSAALTNLAKRIIDETETRIVECEKACGPDRAHDVPRFLPSSIVQVLGMRGVAMAVVHCLHEHGITEIDVVEPEPAKGFRSAIRTTIRHRANTFFGGTQPVRQPSIVIDCISPSPTGRAWPPSILSAVWPDCPVARHILVSWEARHL